MAHRSLREGRFRRRTQLGEDINPSAYIVNLADCMLVFACGLMVALVSAWSINLGATTKLEPEDIEEVDPLEMPSDFEDSGSYYIEAGKVYRDPNTGVLYMVTEEKQ